MKHIIISAILMFYIGISNISAQAYETNKFESFLKLFKIANADSKLRSSRSGIPDKLIYFITDHIEVYDFVSIDPVAILNNDDNITLIIKVGRPQGGYASSFLILCYSSKGEFIKSNKSGFNSIDIDGGTASALYFFGDTILEIETLEFESDINGKRTILSNSYSYFNIDSKGYNTIELTHPSKSRLYPRSSLMILKEDTIAKMDRHNIDIMRNEIFADHGYIFKTDKWRKYFEVQHWYNPRFDDVAIKLTIIEKINIENILKIAPIE